MISEDELSDIVDRFLGAGVPATAVAKALGVDPFVVRDRQSQIRVEQYGAAELSEALANMQWEALQQARWMMTDAPFTVRSRFVMGILSKTMSLTARQSPETIGIMRAQLLEFMRDQGPGSDDDALKLIDPSAFVSTTEADEDQDEGSDD